MLQTLEINNCRINYDAQYFLDNYVKDRFKLILNLSILDGDSNGKNINVYCETEPNFDKYANSYI